MRYLASLAILGLLVAAPAAQAAVVAGDDITIDWLKTGSDNSGSQIRFPQSDLGVYGGPFWAAVYADSASPGVGSGGTPFTSFVTFCLEINEEFTPGTRYDIEGLSGESLNTGKYLTGYAAWVYTVASGYDARDPGNKTLMTDAQRAIWMGMVSSNTPGAIPTPGSSGSELVGTPTFGPIAVAGGGTVNIDYGTFLTSGWDPSSTEEQDMLAFLNGYQVVNVQTSTGAAAQDQVIAPEYTTSIPIPEPASLLIWSLFGGAAGIAAMRRRRA
jgi:hypothetical protein